MGAWPRILAVAEEGARELLRDARQARLRRSLSLVAGLAGSLSGLEVAYLHYRGSYNQRIMWTPVILSQALLAAGIWGAVRPRAARTVLPWVSAVTLADCATGFVFHLRGIAHKPGGFRLLVPNVAMGPPPFAPLLFGLSAYIGLVAARMRPEAALEAEGRRQPPAPHEGALQAHVAAVAGASALCSGIEALYSHHKGNFRYKAQWTPIAMAPVLAAAAFRAAGKTDGRRRRVLAAASGLAMLDGAVGTFYHMRGVARRPGGKGQLLHRIMYGPPVLAPLLFAASGFLGLLAALMQGGKK